MRSNRLFLSLLPFAVLHAFSLAGTSHEISIYQESIIGLRIEEYTPPIHILYGKIVNVSHQPAWSRAFLALRRYGEYDYENWLEYFAPEYIAERKLTKSRFDELKLNYNDVREKLPLETAIRALFVSLEKRKICYVFFYDLEHLKEAPDDLTKLPNAVAIRAFEEIDGSWRNQVIKPGEWTSYLAGSSRNLVGGFTG